MNALYDILTVLPLSLLAVILFGTAAGMPERSVPGYILCLLASVWFVLLRRMKTANRLRSIGIVSVFLIGLTVTAGEKARALFIEEYLWTVRIVCLCLAAMAAGSLMNWNIRIRRAASAALAGYCIAGTALAWEIRREVFLLICFLLLIWIAEEVQLRWSKSGFPEMKGHIVRLSPFFLAACLIVSGIHAPDAPYDWHFVRVLCDGTVFCFNRVYGFFAHPSDDYSAAGKAGFSDSGGFLSGLGDNDEEVLQIRVPNTAIRNFRLVGCISGDFRGREWVFDTEKESTSRLMDTMETFSAVRKYDAAFSYDYLQETDMQYETLFLNTRYVFSPAKIRLEATKEKCSGIGERNGSILSGKRFGYKDDYRVLCYMLNYANPRLADLLRSAQPIEAAEWEQTAKAEHVLEKPGYSFADYQKYRADVYAQYCHSDGLSERACAVLNEIGSGSADRLEAAQKLEAYLRKLEYTTDCGPLPESVSDAASFLDYFLFTSQKGYCMHFATAFVLMANEMGIPCRYVQGYYVRADGSGNMTVRQRDAHAWPEVYFDHIGWVAFDPTPGFSGSAGWQTRADHPYEFIQNDTDPDSGSEEPETDDLAEETGAESGKSYALIFAVPLLAVLVFLLLLWLISRTVSRNKYRRMCRAEQFRAAAQQNIRFLGFLGLRMQEGETLAEYTDRILRSEREDVKAHLGFLPVYETLLYADREITQEEIASAENTNRALRALVKKGRLRFRIALLTEMQK